MKRIYLAFALIGTLFAQKATAQVEIDFAARIDLPTDGTNFPEHGTLDTTQARLGWGAFGPEGLLNQDKILWQWSFNQPADPDSLGNPRWWRWVSTLNQDLPDPGYISVMPNNSMNPPESHAAPYVLAIDSVGILMDWDEWANNDSVVYKARPYVDGQEYGFFIRVYGLYDDVGGTILNTDPDSSNNRAVVRIIWNGSVSSIKDMLPAKTKEALTAYPNPCVNNINIEYKFDKYSDAKARITDLSGRVVLTKNFGRQAPNTQKFNVDVAALPPGMYNIELIMDEKVAISKFSVKR